MSRLIFEGDTTERFGRLFPKPFIQEIRVYDNSIEADVVLYFRIEEDVSAEDFIEAAGLSSLKILTGPISEDNLETARTSENVLTAWQGSIGRSESGLAVINSLVDKEYDLFYNSEGLKFIRFFLTEQFANFAVSGKPQYLISFSFFLPSDADPYLLANNSEEQYKKQFSPISYEKVSNSDGSLNIEREIIFREPDGNAYGKTPLQSLNRNFKKTDTISHRRVREIINPIVTPFVGIIPEADRVSATLSNLSNDPKLLTQLQKDINSFSNKSTATPTGQLYGNLVDAVANIDNLLQGEDTLDKRLEFSNKIKDLRFLSISINNEQLSATSTSELQNTFDTDTQNDKFFASPLVYRRLETSVPPQRFNSQEQAYITTTGYFFFDYEKALNYRSQISRVFNPYNILELFGKNSLNSLFQVQKVDCSIESTSQDLRLRLEDKSDENAFDNFSLSRQRSSGETVYKQFFELYSGNEKYQFVEKFCERAFDTGIGLDGYRLKTYELDYLKHYDYINDEEGITISAHIKDQTMTFYENFIRLPMYELLLSLQAYYDLASEFCSFNNLDNRFNDFFRDSIEEQFEEPYPWQQAPVFYYSILNLFNNSWDNGVRKVDGAGISLENIQNIAKSKSISISPTNGDLDSLSNFIQNFRRLYEEVIAPRGVLDRSVSIYDTSSNDEIIVLNSDEDTTLESAFFNSGQETVDIDVKIVNPNYYEIDYFRPQGLSANTGFESITWNTMYEELVYFVTNHLRADFRMNLVTLEHEYTDDSGENQTVEGKIEQIEHIHDIRLSEILDQFILPRSYTQYNPPSEQNLSRGFTPIWTDFYQTMFEKINSQIITNFDNSERPQNYWKNNFREINSIITTLTESGSGLTRTRRLRRKKNLGDNKQYYYLELLIDLKKQDIENCASLLFINYWNYSYYIGKGDVETGELERDSVTMRYFLKEHLGVIE